MSTTLGLLSILFITICVTISPIYAAGYESYDSELFSACGHFTYNDSDTTHGPSAWGDICEAWSTCKNGTQQSPIDLRSREAHVVEKGQGGLLTISYNDEKNVTVHNNGHTVQINANERDNSIFIRGSGFELKQFHFHHPSEHTIDGVQYPLELHLVHQDHDGNYAVLGFLFQEGKEPNVLLSVIEEKLALVQEDNTTTTLSVVNITDFFNDGFEYYHYNGSFTIPPCTEGVRWFVSSQVLSATTEQLTKFADVLSDDSRPVQGSRQTVFYKNDAVVPDEDIKSSVTQLNVTPLAIFVVALVSLFVAF